MLVLVKIIHFLSFSIGIGGGVANMLIGIKTRGAPAEAIPLLRGLQKAVGRLAFVMIVLLWLTGIYMIYARGGPDGFGAVFWLKILAVVVLTVASGAANYFSMTAARRDPAKLGPLMAKIGMTATGSAILALILAIAAFN
jgi:hypothetical protein